MAFFLTVHVKGQRNGIEGPHCNKRGSDSSSVKKEILYPMERTLVNILECVLDRVVMKF